MSKHTPGPWVIDRDTSRQDGGTRIYVNAAAPGWSSTICRVTGIVEGSTRRWAHEDMSEETQRQDEANAHLIAAAPDLLSVLKRIQKDGGIGHYHGNFGSCLACDINDAIAKAQEKPSDQPERKREDDSTPSQLAQ